VQNWKDMKRQILIRFRQHYSKQEVTQFVLKSCKMINSVWNKEELLLKLKDSFIVLLYKRGEETGCSNYRISLLPTTHTIVSSILLSKLTTCMYEITGKHQCEFRRNRLTTDQIVCIRRMMDKKWRYNGTLY
jgi:hypothetical protein